MKTKTHFLSFFILVFCLKLVACVPVEKEDEIKGDAKESNLKKEESKVLQTEIEDYKRGTSDTISENERLIFEFREKIKEYQKELKEDYEKQISKLEEKNNELKSRVEQYSAENIEKWEKFKAEFKSDLKELGQAIKNFTVEEK